MRTGQLLIIATLGAALPLAEAAAVPAAYTVTGTMSGSLAGVPFTNATITFTTLADTAAVQFQLVGGTDPFRSVIGPTSFTLGGITGSFTGPDSYGAGALDQSASQPGLGAVGIVNLTLFQPLLALDTANPGYDLTTNFTATGAGQTDGGGGFATTAGLLILTSVSGNATFTATVPEPLGAGLLGLGLLGLFGARRLSPPTAA